MCLLVKIKTQSLHSLCETRTSGDVDMRNINYHISDSIRSDIEQLLLELPEVCQWCELLSVALILRTSLDMGMLRHMLIVA